MLNIILVSVFAFLLQTVNGITQDLSRGLLACPVGDCSYITQGFSEEHHAIDYAYPLGTPVLAAADGVVYRAGENCMTDPCANAITLLHEGGLLATNYWHLRDVNVVVGQSVMQGDVIGTVGLTGITTGPHLHFSVQDHRIFVMPTRYMA